MGFVKVVATRPRDGMVRSGYRFEDVYFIGRFEGSAEEFARAGWELADVEEDKEQDR